MFDNTFPNNITITENKAPTDASIRLLAEMESAIEKKILNSIRLDNNELSGIIQYQKDVLTGDDKIGFLIKLNGKEIKKIIDVKEWLTLDEKRCKIIDEVSKTIANEFLSKHITTGILNQLYGK